MEEAVKGEDGVYRYADGTPRDTCAIDPKPPILQFFEYAHLPMNLQEISKPFYQFAHHIEGKLPGNAEKTTFLRKLLEAKDCAVRAFLFKEAV